MKILPPVPDPRGYTGAPPSEFSPLRLLLKKNWTTIMARNVVVASDSKGCRCCGCCAGWVEMGVYEFMNFIIPLALALGLGALVAQVTKDAQNSPGGSRARAGYWWWTNYFCVRDCGGSRRGDVNTLL